MDLKSRVEELDVLYKEVKDLYKEAGWKRKYCPFLAEHDEVFNKKVKSLEEEVNLKITGLEEKLNIKPGTEGIVPYICLTLRTEDYKSMFDFKLNLNNLGRKLCYGMCGSYGGLIMLLKDSQSGVSPAYVGLGVLAGLMTSFLMESYTAVTSHFEEKYDIKDRIKDIKREFKHSKK
ncbi:MAG: hypothetical protein Q8O03_09295 [Nanoarchaeota archaeon]|nr:hypothetical protein [Nanoarchaeota archaeon]